MKQLLFCGLEPTFNFQTLIIFIRNQMLENQEVKAEILNLFKKPSHESCKQYIRKLLRQQNNPQTMNNAPILNATMGSISQILKDNEIHPRIKLQGNMLIMYLVSMMDPDVYEIFQKYVYTIFKGNCLYNKVQAPERKGQDFFKKSKYYTDVPARNQLRSVGVSYILFSLETVYVLAKYYPYEAEDDQTPTIFLKNYQFLLKNGVQFHQQFDFKFYTEQNIQIIEQNLEQVEKQFYSSVQNSSLTNKQRISLQLTSNPQFNNSESKKKPNLTKKSSFNKKSGISAQQMKSNLNAKSLLQEVNQNRKNIQQDNFQSQQKIFILEDDKKKLQKQILTQRRYFEDQISRLKLVNQQNTYRYEKKITQLESQIQLMKKNANPQQVMDPANNKDWMKQKIIDDLQMRNEALQNKVKLLEENLRSNNGRSYQQSNYESLELQVGKLKKQNRNLKAKLLSQCEQTSQFTNKRGNGDISSQKNQGNSLGFIGYEDARSSFEPFYSNSSTQIKIRLRKAIIREKQLLYKDKTIQIGSITKLQAINIIKLIIVFTNVSQKPLFNFIAEFVARDDLTIKVLSTAKNYLQISGQTKTQLMITVNQIDFRCILSSIRFSAEGNSQKLALIMPISKIKLAQQQVFTPISDKKLKYIKKIEKVFKPDRKVLPNLHKFKQYFLNALLETDKTDHQSYHLKILFMGDKFYIECDEVSSQLRLVIKYFEQQKLAEAEKLMDQLIFLFMKA